MILNNEIALFFDKLAPEWDNTPAEFDVREKLTSMMGLLPGSVIADIGCGKGVMFEHLLKTNPEKIIAVDISSEMLRSAQADFCDERIEYINDDFLDAALPALDVVIIFNSYPHFLNKKMLAEKAAQVIKKGGTMIIAHSRNKVKINGVHRDGNVFKLSVPLEDAAVEADKFSPFFAPDVLIDSEEIYFIKMLRK